MSQTSDPTASPAAGLLPPALTLGMATAVAMWFVGFLSHLPGAVWPPAAVGVALLVTQLAGGVLVGRLTPGRPLAHGALAGVVTAALNLFILAGYLEPADPSQQAPASPAAIIATYLAASVFAGAVASLLGSVLRQAPPPARSARVWLARYALVAFAAFAPVLLSGGIVTSAEAGLAVPDWPGSFGALMWMYPVSKMTGGIYFEHAHRLFGMLAGLSTAVLLVFTLLADKRALARGAVVAVSALVIVQAILGGVRVTAADAHDQTLTTTAEVPAEVALDFAATDDNATSIALAMLHGTLGQVTFASLAAVAIVLSVRFWRVPKRDEPLRRDPLLRLASTLLLVALGLQLTLGVATRHMQHFHLMLTHLAFAAIVTIVAFFAGMRATAHREHRQLAHAGYALSVVVILQVALGFVAMLAVLPYDDPTPDTPAQIALATSHQATGAVLLALAAVVFTWARRLTTR
jgi:cytochrome c oxidase assembly protein subunit 15